MDFDHSLSGSQRAVTVFVAPFCTEVSDPETPPRRAASHAELVPGVFHTPLAMGEHRQSLRSQHVLQRARAQRGWRRPRRSALPTRSFSTNRARSRSPADSESTLTSTSAFAPTARAKVSTGASRFCTLVELSTELRECQRLPQPAIGRDSKLVQGRGELADLTGALLDEPQMSGERAMCLLITSSAPRATPPERGRAAPS